MSLLILDPHSVVIPPDRFREARPERVEALAASFLKFGQLEPIGVRQMEEFKVELVYGLHRLLSCRANGSPISAIVVGTEDELLLREMELEENLMREMMHFMDVQKALVKLHEMKIARDPNWTQAKTAALVDERGQAAVAEAVKIVKMAEMFPEIATAKNKRQALSWASAKAKQVMRVHEVKDGVIDYSDIESKIVLGDSVEVIKSVANESFHAIITDPPFGIDYDSRKAGTQGSISDYQDDEGSYRKLLSMAPDLYRVLKHDGWLVWFFGMSWYGECKQVFRDAGFTVDELPIVWNRSSGRCHTNRPDRYFSRGYDVALHCFKGDPQIIQRGKPNVLTIDPVETKDRDFLVERPVELYAELIRRLTVPGETVADFFVGSGSCPAAAASLGRDYFGVEQSAERRAGAITKIRAHTPTPEQSNAQVPPATA